MTRTDYDIERAWAAHQPERAKVPEAIKRQLRLFKRELTGPADVIAKWIGDKASRDDAADYVCKRGIGRERALARIKRTVPGAHINPGPKFIELRWLEPSGRVIVDARTPGDMQDCILAYFAAAWGSGRGMHLWSRFFVEIPDHAAWRLLQRGGSQVDLRHCLMQASDAFADGDAKEVMDYLSAKRTIYLPAGPGVFLSEIIAGIDDKHKYYYARARTWLSAEMLAPQQRTVTPAKKGSESVLAWLLALMRREQYGERPK